MPNGDDDSTEHAPSGRPAHSVRVHGRGTPLIVHQGIGFSVYRRMAPWILPEPATAPLDGLCLQIRGAELRRLRVLVERDLRAVLDAHVPPHPGARKVVRMTLFGREYRLDPRRDDAADLACYLDMAESSLRADEALCFDFEG